LTHRRRNIVIAPIRGIETHAGRLTLYLPLEDNSVHVLIIEDEPLIAMSIEVALEGAGVTSFDIADSEAQAVDCARTRRPDFITSDVNLKSGNGPSAVRAILAELGHIPVMFITANPDRCRMENCSGPVLGKPFVAGDVERAFQLAVAA
jgi:CheY-like chemotaxis protein